MKKKFLLALAVLMLVPMMAACSDNDAPGNEDGPDSSWRKDLETIVHPVTHSDLVGWGGQYAHFAAGFIIEDKEGNNLMESYRRDNVINSDYYFLYDGKEYRNGDKVTVGGQYQSVVGAWTHVSGQEMLAFFWIDYEKIAKAGRNLDVSYEFVWPSRNIRKTMRVYIEPNVNYTKELEAYFADKSLPDTTLEIYKSGFWVDGKPYKTMGMPWYRLVIE